MTPGQLDGGEERKLEFKFRSHSGVLDGRAYLLSFLIRSFSFHVATAHDILRQRREDGKERFSSEASASWRWVQRGGLP
jgi:hypothetical protein